MPGDWTRLEVEATVSDYFQMLAAEISGEKYDKSEHNRHLRRLLAHRSRGAVEFKHQNISAILIELGHPWIDGYKPRWNYQDLLFEVVSDEVAADSELVALMRRDVDRVAQVPAVVDILKSLEEAPRGGGRAPYARRLGEPRNDERRTGPILVNYLELEARNASLGAAGEEFVVRFERARLISENQSTLADRVERVSITTGDWLGYDIHSFETDGSDRYIEVKTTAYGKETPFYVTRNEVAASHDMGGRYHLYRAFRFRREPRMYTASGALEDFCVLDPVQFSAYLR